MLFPLHQATFRIRVKTLILENNYIMQIARFFPLALATGISAFPNLALRQSLPEALPLSENEGNSGPIPSNGFNAADQFVDVRPGTAHQFIAPGPTDERGPCPGLNAAANHGFLQRNGINTIAQTVSGLSEAYSFGDEFAAALSVIAIALTGDPVAETWSIGGPYTGALGGLQGTPEGISFSHNAYESDASPARVSIFQNSRRELADK